MDMIDRLFTPMDRSSDRENEIDAIVRHATKEPVMYRKTPLFTALLFASGALAQPMNAATADAGPATDARTDPPQTIHVQWNKNERAIRTARDPHAHVVWIKGDLLTTDDDMQDVKLTVEVRNGECRRARIRKNGRFDVVLTAGSSARLIFNKTDHLSKEVLVDASNLTRNLIARGEDRKVNFDVVLVPDSHLPGYVLDGPVGSIIFRRGSGAMTVHHHERLVAVERVCPRVK